MRSFAAIVLTLSIALTAPVLLAGCGGGGGVSVTVVGVVADAGTLAAIVNAIVSASTNQETTTDVTGSFLLDGVSEGKVRVSAAGYQDQDVTVPAGSGTIDLGTIFLVPTNVPGTGLVAGTITQAGSVVSGASVRAGVRQAVTRPDGTYTLYNVLPGAQTILAVSPDQSAGGSKNINVYAGQLNTADIQLILQPPPLPVIN